MATKVAEVVSAESAEREAMRNLADFDAANRLVDVVADDEYVIDFASDAEGTESESEGGDDVFRDGESE